MIAAINMQWLGIGIAALVVVVLLIIVLVRHRGEDERLMTAAPASRPAGPPAGPPAGQTGPAASQAEPLLPTAAAAATAATPAGSFLDEPLVHGFEGLGKTVAPAAPPAPSGPFPVDPFGSHEDIFPPEAPAAEPLPDAEAASPTAAPAEAVATATAPGAAAAGATPAPDPAAAATPAAEPDAPAPLSEIIVTSSHEEVDLADPDVRALLVSLVDDEIGLARACRAQGQTLDAILQLTEAEKACTALGLDDKLAEVKALLAELQG